MTDRVDTPQPSTTDATEELASHDASTSAVRRFVVGHPLGLFHLLLGATILLLALGLVMVLSASSIVSLRLHESVYTLAQRQAMFAVIGVAAMLFSSRLPVKLWRFAAWPSIALAIALLVAVILIGVEVSGQRNWLDIMGPFRLQPSEIAKFAVVIWAADVLARKEALLDRWSHLLIPLLPVVGLMLVLVLMGGDVGNTIIIAAIVTGILFAAGAPLRLFVALGALGGVVLAGLTMAAPYRMSRFTAWLDPAADPLGEGWQLTQGQYALGTGGWWGVGLGASREKWGSLPEAHTDFIFSVIGEELGLIGTVMVLILFATITFVAFRISQTSSDMFIRLASAGVGTWIAFQGIVNIGAVLGLLPIAGVALPLVSYGGSSLVPLLVGIGMVLSFARTRPVASDSMGSDIRTSAQVRA
jgi:cell division protein FtsW